MGRGFAIITWAFLLRCGRKVNDVDDAPVDSLLWVDVVVARNVEESDSVRTESYSAGRCVVAEVVSIFQTRVRVHVKTVTVAERCSRDSCDSASLLFRSHPCCVAFPPTSPTKPPNASIVVILAFSVQLRIW